MWYGFAIFWQTRQWSNAHFFGFFVLFLQQLLWQNVRTVERVLLPMDKWLWFGWQAKVGAGCAMFAKLVTVDHVFSMLHQIKRLWLQHSRFKRTYRVLAVSICRAKCLANFRSDFSSILQCFAILKIVFSSSIVELGDRHEASLLRRSVIARNWSWHTPIISLCVFLYFSLISEIASLIILCFLFIGLRVF